MNETVQPGISIYGSDFRNSGEQDLVQVNSNVNKIVDHGPTLSSTQGLDVINYEIGVRVGVEGAEVTSTQSQSYFLKNTKVTDFSQDVFVSWLHDIDSRTVSGKLTFEIIPGWTVLLAKSDPIDLDGVFTTTFDRLRGNDIAESKDRTIALGVFGG